MRLKTLLTAILLACLLPVSTLSAFAASKEKTISDFENGSDGWSGEHHLADGYNSQTALRLSNPENGSNTMYKNFNLALLQGYENIELDLRTKGGNLLPGDASALVIEQGGWKWVSLSNYMQKDNNDWQHLTIPLSDFSGLDTNKGIVRIIFRFWNYSRVNQYIDNIKLTGQKNLSPKLLGYPACETEIDLTWQGEGDEYNIFLNNQKIGSTSQQNYRISNLSPSTEYSIYVTAVESGQDSAQSNTINLTTPSLAQTKSVITNFEAGHPEGWRGIVNMTGGYNSNYSMRVSNPAWGSADAYKSLGGNKIALGFNQLELDINLNGGYLLPGDASALYFDQGGWKWVSLYDYVKNGFDGWQHISIPLTDLSLDTQEGITQMGFRFWNYKTNYHVIDNIILTNK